MARRNLCKNIFSQATLLIALCGRMDMKVIQLTALDYVGVLVLSVVAAQAKDGVIPRHLVAKNRREIQRV